MTTQRMRSKCLAERGWLCHAVPNRLVVFNGKVLHGVIPGKGVASRRRVTVMFAFWKDIQERGGSEECGFGAARVFPTKPDWARRLLQPMKTFNDDVDNESNDKDTSVATDPIPLDCVYERVQDGVPWTPSMGIPEYDQVFQGF